MRIISKFHDYYDCIQKYGHDDGILFIRNQEEIWLDKYRRDYCDRFQNICFDKFTIGFAGKYYLCLQFHGIKVGNGLMPDFKTVNCYSLADVDKVIENELSKKKLEVYYANNKKPRSYKHWSPGGRYHFVEIFEKFESAGHLNYFDTYKTPIFVSTTSKVIVNPRLKDYDFVRVLDPQTAYQELRMYLSNQASPEKPIPHISDVDMRDIKGFDKFSFKKEKAL